MTKIASQVVIKPGKQENPYLMMSNNGPRINLEKLDENSERSGASFKPNMRSSVA